jgi:hypothetical protein
MPRAALLSIHAPVERTGPSTWADPSLVQLWGPRFSVVVVAARDLAVFSLGTLPDDAKGRRRAYDLGARLSAVLDGARMTYGEAGRALGVHPNSLRYAAATGTVLIRWQGARQRGPIGARTPVPAHLRPRNARGPCRVGWDRRTARRRRLRRAPQIADASSDTGRRSVDPHR